MECFSKKCLARIIVRHFFLLLITYFFFPGSFAVGASVAWPSCSSKSSRRKLLRQPRRPRPRRPRLRRLRRPRLQRQHRRRRSCKRRGRRRERSKRTESNTCWTGGTSSTLERNIKTENRIHVVENVIQDVSAGVALLRQSIVIP